MITSRDVSGNDRHEQPDEVFVQLIANNGIQARYSLFALGLKEIPETVNLQGRIYERGEGKVFTEKAEVTEQAPTKPLNSRFVRKASSND